MIMVYLLLRLSQMFHGFMFHFEVFYFTFASHTAADLLVANASDLLSLLLLSSLLFCKCFHHHIS